MELVSVVVPVYRAEDYLENCVGSIQKQTYPELEIILVDDGSPDKSGEICDRLKKTDDRISVIHKENGGPGSTRNAGAKAAAGKYLLFVDSDDEIVPDLVEKTVKIAEAENCDMVLFDYLYITGGEEEWRTDDVPANRIISMEDVPEILLMPPSPCTKLYNRSFYIGTGHLFPEGVYYEDLENAAKMYLEAKRIWYLKEPLYHYLVREQSIMTTPNFDRNYHDKEIVMDEILRFYKEKGMHGKYRYELEYLAFANVYFEPSKEIVLYDRKNPNLERFRRYMYKRFPDFHTNPYVKQLNAKGRLHLWILDTRQYWLMCLLSNCRKLADKVRK